MLDFEETRTKMYQRQRAKTRFIPRCPELLAIEGDYGDFKLSCRHRDILRASDTNHFVSCFRPAGLHNLTLLKYCSEVDNVAVIFKCDKSGKFKSRAFVMFSPAYVSYQVVPNNGTYRIVPAELVIQKVYGNGLNNESIEYILKSKTGYEVRSTGGDHYL